MSARTIRPTACLVALLALAAASPSGGQVLPALPDLHVLFIADTDDRGIGEGCNKDRERVESLFTGSVPSNRTVKLKVFSGKKAFPPAEAQNNFTQKHVRDYLGQIPLGPTTGVLVYFSGHGDYSPKDGHRMVIPTDPADMTHDGRMPNDDVFRAVAARNQPVRMIAVITDSCCPNVGPPTRGAPRTRFVVSRNAAPPHLPAVLDDLFFKLKPTASGAPLIDINGAAEGQLAYGPPDLGGFFTNGFDKALRYNGAEETKYASDTNKDGLLTWHEFLPRAIKETETIFNVANAAAVQQGQPKLTDANGKEQPSQTPQAFRLPKLPDNHKYPFKLGVVLDEQAPAGGGVKVARVSGPAAGKVQVGDVIRTVNGRTVRGHSDLLATIDIHPDPVLQFQLERNGASVTVSVTRTENK